MLSASGGQPTSLTVLMNRVADPVDSRVVSDRNVARIDKDNFIILVGGVLVDPVRVQHSQVGADTSSSFLCNASEISDEFKLVDTLVLRLSVHDTAVVGPLASTSADGHSINDKSLK